MLTCFLLFLSVLMFLKKENQLCKIAFVQGVYGHMRQVHLLFVNTDHRLWYSGLSTRHNEINAH